MATNSMKIKPGCPYYRRCKEFFNSLTALNYSLFGHEFDMCYCMNCHTWRGDSEVYSRGNPPKDYGLPIGWVRFSLQEPAQGKSNNAGANWHRAFHGTPVSCIKPILDVSRLVAAGRNVENGKLEICHAEEGREDWHVYLSPSIKYAGYYGDPESFRTSDGTWYQVRVAIYAFISPASYKIKPGKIRDQRQKDPNFRLSELEWYTEDEGGHLLYGVMVNMEKP